MAKKSFKDNPALQFISSAPEGETTTAQVTELGQGEQKTTATPKEVKLETGRKAPEGYKLNPMYVETKSKRLQLVIQPSLLARVRQRAEEQGLSVNEYIHRTLDKATREEE